MDDPLARGDWRSAAGRARAKPPRPLRRPPFTGRADGVAFRQRIAEFQMRYPHWTYAMIADAINDHLRTNAHSTYARRTLLRQMAGSTSTVRAETMDALTAVIASLPHEPDARTVAAPIAYVPYAEVQPLIALWYLEHPDTRWRTLTRALIATLRSHGHAFTYDTIAHIVAGSRQYVQKAVRDALLAVLDAHARSSVPAASRATAHADALVRPLRERSLVEGTRFRALCRIWLTAHPGPVRALARTLHARLRTSGYAVSRITIERCIVGRRRLVRQFLITALSAMLHEEDPERSWTRSDAEARMRERERERAWTDARTCVTRARSWLAAHPAWTHRRLAVACAAAASRRGYTVTDGAFRSLLRGTVRKTRAFMVDAMNRTITAADAEAQLLALAAAPANGTPPLDAFLADVRAHLAHARHPRFRALAAARATHLYGISREEFEARIRDAVAA